MCEPLKLPIVEEVDVLIYGGNTRACAAALSAAHAGCNVTILAPRPFLGEDICSTLSLWARSYDFQDAPLCAEIWPEEGKPTTPMHVKRFLADKLCEAGVNFYLEVFVVDVLKADDGTPCGVVTGDRAGLQVFTSTMFIDATERAAMARLAGAESVEWPGGKIRFERVVIGGEPRELLNASISRKCLGTVADRDGEAQVYEYEFEMSVQGGDFRALAHIEEVARNETFQLGQLRAAERVQFYPPDHLFCVQEVDSWERENGVTVDSFRVDGLERMFVLGPCAAIPRTHVEEVMSLPVAEVVAYEIGSAVACEASLFENVEPAGLSTHKPKTQRLSALLQGLRSVGEVEKRIEYAPELPEWGEYDVLVVGGGTAGSSVAIGAGEHGATTLLVEYQEGLGGVGTLGMIGKPWFGNAKGFASRVPWPGEGLTLEDKMEWFRREASQVGVEIWNQAMGCAALLDGDAVKGVLVATPGGAGIVRARVVVDATGNGDIAIAAGAAYHFGEDERDIALQGVGLPVRSLYSPNANSDYLLVDESDMIDSRRARIGSAVTMKGDGFDIGPLIQSRERRRIAGEHTLRYLDQIAGRTYPDSVVYSYSDYDAHGYPSQDYFALIPHDEESIKANHPAPGGDCYTPYRCFLPKGLDNILVGGIALSMERDASALVRMQFDIHNQGYALGLIAATAARNHTPLREVDIRKIQKKLCNMRAMPEEVLEHEDSFPLSEEVLNTAVKELVKTEELGREYVSIALAKVMSNWDRAHKLVTEAWQQAEGQNRIVYAKILAVMGDDAPVTELVRTLRQAPDWEPRIKQGNMAEYAHLPTPVDALVLALGRTRRHEAISVLLTRLETLDADVPFSHHRAMALSIEAIGSTQFRPAVVVLLKKKGMMGHVMEEIEPIYNEERDLRRRLGALREIIWARALFRCGDADGLGKNILLEYTQDVRGLFARHAEGVLKNG